jgi:hypothetical protein
MSAALLLTIAATPVGLAALTLFAALALGWSPSWLSWPDL